MTSTAEKKATLIPDYQQFLRSLDLYMVALSDVNCKIDRDEYWRREKDDERNTTYRIETKSTAIEADSFEVRSTLTLEIKGEKSKSAAVRIVASFDLFLDSKTTSKEFIDRFCESDVILIVMPYFREFVTDMTAKMHIPPLVLPLSTKR